MWKESYLSRDDDDDVDDDKHSITNSSKGLALAALFLFPPGLCGETRILETGSRFPRNGVAVHPLPMAPG